MKKLVLTVCMGNIHRSVVAAFCINREAHRLGMQDYLYCESRGLRGSYGTGRSKGQNLYDYPAELALTGPVLQELGIIISHEQSATPIDASIITQADLIFAMDQSVLKALPYSLFVQFPEYVDKMALYDELVDEVNGVADCGGSTDATLHRHINYRIDEVARKGMPKLLKMLGIAN